ncbi:AAA family ATPase [Colletotrichum truncatum]|uniref:AAA family ATPase n=1 Tax=Colletotrichum truncatum TaxID=5467 RepID=A0ACC3YXJ0_COLTU|nr:AAA family ATPase [Colletotrichum truncatum]KAF6791013.1 AAA family ATPase [Colletotrichum truncatum]
MSRSRALAILQKTYDDSYLKCSTAVYYESQGDEDEAMRCWKNALEQICDQHITKVLPNYEARSETEDALLGSLRQLELQCKERIDLLEALRISRQDAMTSQNSNVPTSQTISSSPVPPRVLTPERGWIGQGTIPAIKYPELPRPSLPNRPSLVSRTSSEKAVIGRDQSPANTTSLAGSLSSPSLSAKKEQTMRSPSPEKYTMRTTLRSGKSGEKPFRPSRKVARNDEPGASKAATLAWSVLGSKERLNRTPPTIVDPSSSTSPSVTGLEHFRKPLVSSNAQWDVHTRRLVTPREVSSTISDAADSERNSNDLSHARPSALSVSAASSALNAMSIQDATSAGHHTPEQERTWRLKNQQFSASRSNTPLHDRTTRSDANDSAVRCKSSSDTVKVRRKPVAANYRRDGGSTANGPEQDVLGQSHRDAYHPQRTSSSSFSEAPRPIKKETEKRRQVKRMEDAVIVDADEASSDESLEDDNQGSSGKSAWEIKEARILKNLPSGVDGTAAKQIINEIVVHGDEVHWSDIAGLEIAKNALRETVVYPFLRPDLFMGLREPARGMLLFGPPGTGKTMLARAVATESRSTFFSISASSLTSKYLGESEKLVRALFSLAKALAPSIIFVDEIDSLLSQRSGSGEHEATRRIKTEFLIQWSDLQRAAAGRVVNERERGRGDPNRVLVLAATNLPWAIDEAARRRFVRRQYIPLPEPGTRSKQLRTLLGQQKHSLTDSDIERLVTLTDGFSGSDITALAKDAAMGPLRSLGEALLRMTMDEIRPISLSDFEASLTTIRPSVNKAGLKEYEDWAKEFGERGG